jgi:ZipA, C-terminal FtsZ-binding domain
MSALQISLAVAGGVVLAAVVAHGAWNSRRNQPRQADPEPARIDPVGGNTVLDPATDAAQFPLPTPEKKPGLDALIDVMVPLTFDSPISGDAALGAMPATRRVGSKPFAVEGFNEQTQIWELPLVGQRYKLLQVGVQLANRTGALNDIEYSEFVVKAQAFADALGGMPEFPEMRDEVARARELDQFASGHDAQLSVTLRARHAAWSPGYVQQNAARLGFVAGVIPGRMVLPASVLGQSSVLGLIYDSQAALAEDPTQSAIHELSLNLDVPQVDRHEQPFVRMRLAAQQLADTMDGLVTDDNGQPLNAQALDVIGAELEKLYDTLDDHDLSAGSALARRLFS